MNESVQYVNEQFQPDLWAESACSLKLDQKNDLFVLSGSQIQLIESKIQLQ